MKIVIFGANSPTAQLLINKFLDQPKNDIIYMVREVNSILIEKPGIKYLKYQLNELDQHSQALADAPYLTQGTKIQKVRAQAYFFNDDKSLNRLSLAFF